MIWIVIIAAFVLFGVISNLIESKQNRERDNKNYANLLEHCMEKVKDIGIKDIEDYERKLKEVKESVKDNKDPRYVVYHNQYGEIYNLCSKCKSSMRIVRARKTFLGCSKYPTCVSYGKISDLKRTLEF